VYFIVIFPLHFVLKKNLDQWYQSRLLLIVFQCMSPTRSEYRKLVLETVSLKDNCSRSPKKPSMVEEKKNDGAEDSIRLLQTFVGNLFGAKFHKGVRKNQHILKRGSACFIHSCGWRGPRCILLLIAESRRTSSQQGYQAVGIVDNNTRTTIQHQVASQGTRSSSQPAVSIVIRHPAFQGWGIMWFFPTGCLWCSLGPTIYVEAPCSLWVSTS